MPPLPPLEKTLIADVVKELMAKNYPGTRKGVAKNNLTWLVCGEPYSIFLYGYHCPCFYTQIVHNIIMYVCMPTVARVDISSVRLIFWDLGGQEDLQSLWDKVCTHVCDV